MICCILKIQQLKDIKQLIEGREDLRERMEKLVEEGGSEVVNTTSEAGTQAHKDRMVIWLEGHLVMDVGKGSSAAGLLKGGTEAKH